MEREPVGEEFPGLGVLAERKIEPREIQQGVLVLRIVLEKALQNLRRGIELSLVGIKDSEVVFSFFIRRLEGQYAMKERFGFLRTALARFEDAEVVEGFGVFGRQLLGAFEGRLRCGQIAVQELGVAQIVPGLDEVRQFFRCLLKQLPSLLLTARL